MSEVRPTYVGERAPLYCDVLASPTQGARNVVFVHGGGVTGACWLTTPDSRAGWAQRFAARGYTAVVPDWPGTGRSPAPTTTDVLDYALVADALGDLLVGLPEPVILVVHSMAGPLGYRLLERHRERIAALVAVAPAPPGNIQAIPEVLDRTSDAVTIRGSARDWRIPLHGSWTPTSDFLLGKVVGASTRFPRRHLAHAASFLTPIPARMLFQRQNVDGSQIRVADAADFTGTPILLVTGDRDDEHPREADLATAEWLRALGAEVTFEFLDQDSFSGGGHWLMGETNSDAIADVVLDWLASIDT